MDNVYDQMRKALEEIKKPPDALRMPFWNFLSPEFEKAKWISRMAHFEQRDVKLTNSIERAAADIEKVSRSFALDEVAELEKLTRPFQIEAAEIDRMNMPFGMDKAKLARITNPFGSQIEQIEKIRNSIFGSDKASRIGQIEAMLGGNRADAEEMFRSLTTSSITDAFNKFEWSNLSATIASAAEATNKTEIQSAVKQALAVSKSDKANTSSALSEFLQALLKVSGANNFEKFVVWYFVIKFLETILISASMSTTDYYVKDYLSKAAQTEDRRALAKEVAKEIGRLNLAREYVSARRYAIKPLDVYMNPRAKSPVIGSVLRGELVEVVQVDRDWTHVVFRDSKGKEFSGWAYTLYLKVLPSRRAIAEE